MWSLEKAVNVSLLFPLQSLEHHNFHRSSVALMVSKEMASGCEGNDIFQFLRDGMTLYKHRKTLRNIYFFLIIRVMDTLFIQFFFIIIIQNLNP